MRRLASYVRTANERLSRDAFEEVADDEDEKNSSKSKPHNVDRYTTKTLREFNDELDEFASISPKKPLAVSGMIIIAMVIAFGSGRAC